MILNKDRRRALAGKWKYLILPATLIAIVAWMLIPARLAKPGLAQQAGGDLNELLEKYMGDSRNFDDLVETALTSPKPETRLKAFLRLIILEGDGSSAALVKLYNGSNDPTIKEMIIRNLYKRHAVDQLATIAQTEQSPEVRRMLDEEIKELNEPGVEMSIISSEKLRKIELLDDPVIVDYINKVSKNPALVRTLEDGMPPPPPPPPSEAMTVTARQKLKPIVDDRGESVFDLLREVADANIRRDTSFFERVLDEDYRETGPNGETMNKAQAIADAKRLDVTIKKFEFDDLNVSGDEHSAFATFLGTVYFQANGQDSTMQYRYTVNFIKRNGQLKIAAVHMTQKH